MIEVEVRSSAVEGRFVASAIVDGRLYSATSVRAVASLSRQLVIAGFADDSLRVRIEGLARPLTYSSFQSLAFRPGYETLLPAER